MTGEPMSRSRASRRRQLPAAWASDTSSNAAELVLAGEALRPPSPVHLIAEVGPAGDLKCRWCRRSRLGWAWVDGVDAPLGCSAERYRVRIQGGTSAVEVETSAQHAAFSSADLAELGSGEVTVSVVQVGDLATSHPAAISIS